MIGSICIFDLITFTLIELIELFYLFPLTLYNDGSLSVTVIVSTLNGFLKINYCIFTIVFYYYYV
jgi:hypothetical protein